MLSCLMHEGLPNHGHGVSHALMVAVATFVRCEADWHKVVAADEGYTRVGKSCSMRVISFGANCPLILTVPFAANAT